MLDIGSKLESELNFRDRPSEVQPGQNKKLSIQPN